jgi:D-cysteine desulfhydrase
MEMEQLAHKFGVSPDWEEAKKRLECFEEYHFSGYGQQREQVNKQIQSLHIQGTFKLDPVYTAKAFIGMITELQKIDGPKKVLFIHTGGVLGF